MGPDFGFEFIKVIRRLQKNRCPLDLSPGNIQVDCDVDADGSNGNGRKQRLEPKSPFVTTIIHLHKMPLVKVAEDDD